jgi:hypothetical protein
MPQVRWPRLRAWWDDTLWGPETGARLVVAHVGLSALIGLRIALGSYRQLAVTPPALVDPVPLLFWLDRMPSAWVFVAIQVVGVVAAVAAVLRRRPRLAFAVAWLSYLVLAGLRGSRGKVLHNDLLLLWASAPFLLAPVQAAFGDAWRDRMPRRTHGWPIRVATVIVVLVYFFAGYHKLRRSGIDWVIGDNMRYVMLWGPSVGQPAWSDLTRWVGEHIWAARASAAFILGLEVLSPAILVWRRFQPLFAVGAVFLHVMTWFVLGLDYWAWAVAVPLLLIDWPGLVAWVQRRLEQRREVVPQWS